MGSLKKEQWIAISVALAVVTIFLLLGNSFGLFNNEPEVALQGDTQAAAYSMAEENTSNDSVAPINSAPLPVGEDEVAGGGFQMKDIVVGTGAQAAVGDTVTVNYTGKFTNGQVFDSSIPRGKPFTFTIGQGSVIAGWEQGLVGMKEGGKRNLVVPPELGYGPQDYGPIPGNSTLLFEVELLKVQK